MTASRSYTGSVCGKGYAIETLEDFRFKISPKSFFQTNTRQAEKLYSITREFAGLTGTEIVYDLYCGTGSIGILSKQAKSDRGGGDRRNDRRCQRECGA